MTNSEYYLFRKINIPGWWELLQIVLRVPLFVVRPWYRPRWDFIYLEKKYFPQNSPLLACSDCSTLRYRQSEISIHRKNSSLGNLGIYQFLYFTTKKIKSPIFQQVIIGDYDSRIKGNLKKRMKVEKVIVHKSFVNSKTGFGKTKKGIVCQLCNYPRN